MASNAKYLIETLIQIPDADLLAQLMSDIVKAKQLLIPDLHRFFYMISCLFQNSDTSIRKQAYSLYITIFSKVLVTEVQQSWHEVSKGVLVMLGEENDEVRKIAKNLVFDLIERTNNTNLVLQKLYYDGLQSQSILIMISSIKLIIKIIETYKTILHNKTSITVTKLIIEKMLHLSNNGRHIELQRTARQFLDKLFYLQVQKMDQVLTLLNSQMLKMLEKIWAENKEKMIYREEAEKQNDLRKAMHIQYEHLPLINGKFFNVYEPYVLKHIFNPDVQQAKFRAIKIFHTQFEQEEGKLQKYINVIYKVIVRFLPEKHYPLILMLKRILGIAGKANIINLAVLPGILVPQLDYEQVPYRKEVRDVLKILNLDIPKLVLKKYEEYLLQNPNITWLPLHEILCLLEHWLDNNLEGGYPPTLNNFLPPICHHLQSGQIKVKQKSLQVLLIILDRYPGYRENLEDFFKQERIAQIEDLLEERRNRSKNKKDFINQAEEIFRKEYEEERQRYIQFKKERKNS